MACHPRGGRRNVGTDTCNATALSKEQISQIIEGCYKFPPRLEQAVKASGVHAQVGRPNNLKPLPPNLANHPAITSTEKVKSGDIPVSGTLSLLLL